MLSKLGFGLISKHSSANHWRNLGDPQKCIFRGQKKSCSDLYKESETSVCQLESGTPAHAKVSWSWNIYNIWTFTISELQYSCVDLYTSLSSQLETSVWSSQGPLTLDKVAVLFCYWICWELWIKDRRSNSYKKAIEPNSYVMWHAGDSNC